MMIIDGHVHIFEKVNGANAQGCVRGTRYGQVENAGCETAFIPPMNEKTCFTLPMLQKMMQQNGVEKALLLQNPTIGIINDLIGQSIVANPETFAGVVQADPFQPNASDEIKKWLSKYPYAAIKMELSTGWGWTGIHFNEPFHYSMLQSVADIAMEWDIPVIFDTGDTSSHAYLPDELEEFVDQNPGVKFVIEHGGYLTPDGDKNIWHQMISLGRKDNVYMGFCAVPTLLGSEYPCREAVDVLNELYETVGPDKLFWGTDAPTTLKTYTYEQLIRWAYIHAEFLTEEDRRKLFYDNALKLFFRTNSDCMNHF